MAGGGPNSDDAFREKNNTSPFYTNVSQIDVQSREHTDSNTMTPVNN